MDIDKPQVVRTHDVQLDADYVQWLGEIKARYRSAQAKAAVRVNAEQLLFNWQLGRDLVQKKAEERWGSGVVEQVSLDLQAAFPESKGFSTTNLWYMKQWYGFYYRELEKLPQLVGELQSVENKSDIKLHQLGGELVEDKLHQLGGEIKDKEGISFPVFFALVPWKHHVEIVTKCKTIEEALFYIKRTIAGNWSRATLMNCIKSDLYHTSGGAVTNFADRLPSVEELKSGFVCWRRNWLQKTTHKLIVRNDRNTATTINNEKHKIPRKQACHPHVRHCNDKGAMPIDY